ncbi:MAG: pantetheine-phosphate adenylyltransferase [Holosporales bacterium]
MRVAVYPGTFDPITLGHVDIIKRAGRLCDHLVVAVAKNAGKGPIFSLDQRLELVKQDVKDLPFAVSVVSFDILLIDFMRQMNANLIIRGIRAVADFEYEFQMAGMNARLAPDIETVFLMASDRCQFISSRLIKEIVALKGDVRQFVSDHVASALMDLPPERFQLT